ncbi:unnamed protein product [Schistosoma mattheei]|uniref:Uncharacterized protein n=1 Tax=Schistosoma mattheei TaxID=31246 RepID=A0A183PR23_9TREM|nr:unnamed protein product [Schistosoma mattheei]
MIDLNTEKNDSMFTTVRSNVIRPKTARHKDPKCKLKVEFDINQLQDLRNDLEELWPSLNNYSTSASF